MKFRLLCTCAVLALAHPSSPAHAACSGSGTTYNCTAGSSSNDISSALSGAADGATLTFAAGNYSWNSFVSFNNAKGATLICASLGACKVSASGTVLGMNGNLSGDNNKFYRVSGFEFTGGNMVIWFYGRGTLRQFRIDNNKFTIPAGNTTLFFGENTTVGQFYGVVDHNTFTASNNGNVMAFNYIGVEGSTPLPSPAGKAENLFFEDNVITNASNNNSGLGCIDGWGGNNTVYRRNTSTNCLVTSHGATHAGGPANFELYDNDIRVNSGGSGQGIADCYRCFHHQGSGEFYAFNNKFTAASGKSGVAISMLDYRAYANSIDGGAPICDGNQSRDGNRSPSTTYRGYPCWHQPGRDFATTPKGGNLKPMYVWNNFWTDTKARVPMAFENLGGNPNYTTQHAKNDRDWFNAVSASEQTSRTAPFNGSTGMGFGTMANRPTSCSTGATDPADAGQGGVGYFATDQGPMGTLYRCGSTDTWVVAYTPYIYPHPLVSGSTPPDPPVPPDPPIPPAGDATTLFASSDTPKVVSENDSNSVELGVKFRSSVAGNVTGVRFYKGSQNTGTHTGALWSANGNRLATVTFSGESASGWQQANFTSPVAVQANTTYVVSYHSGGRYSADTNYFVQTYTNAPLSAPSGNNGVYKYGSAVAFPTDSYQGTNYWVDVVFAPTSPEPPQPAVTPVIVLAASGRVGQAFSYTVTANNAPTTYEATGLPDGLSINAGTGVISGTPRTAGEYSVGVKASNDAGSDSETLRLTVQ